MCSLSRKQGLTVPAGKPQGPRLSWLCRLHQDGHRGLGILMEEGVQLHHMCWGRRVSVAVQPGHEDRAFGPYSLCMADSQAWLTSWKMVVRDCGSPWKRNMALGPVAHATQGGPNHQR
jgi:hypothetical protein